MHHLKGEKDANDLKQPRATKGHGKSKPSISKNVSVTQVKNKKVGKEAEKASGVTNGSRSVDAQPKQPIKTRSFNDRKGHMSKVHI